MINKRYPASRVFDLIAGDVIDDSKINSNDAAWQRGYLYSTYLSPETYRFENDLNADGVISDDDVAMLVSNIYSLSQNYPGYGGCTPTV